MSWSKKILQLCELLFEIIFPKSDREIEMEKISLEDFVSLGPTVPSIAILPYKNQKVQTLIYSLKYDADPKAIEICAKILIKPILKLNIRNAILIPIPRTKIRLQRFGFSQCEILCEEILKNLEIKNLNLKYESQILIHKKDFETQTKLSRKERIKNTKNSFLIKNPEKIIAKNIILIDDVFTTGATITEAKNTLLKAGAKSVFPITIAH